MEATGDAYMCAAGVPDENDDHAEVMCHLALGMLWETRSVPHPTAKRPLQLRVGLHSGPVVAGVVGASTSRYASDSK